MYSFPSASQICEPCPRTMNGASHSTDLNARTGEFTPPGINPSARFCSRRHSSSLRAIHLLVVFYVRTAASAVQSSNIPNSPTFHYPYIFLQSATAMLSSVRPLLTGRKGMIRAGPPIILRFFCDRNGHQAGRSVDV